MQTDDPKSKLADIILHVQFYFIDLGRSIDAFTTAPPISKFLIFEPTFDGPSFSDIYSPWDGLDHSARANILTKLKPAVSKRRAVEKNIMFGEPKNSGASRCLPPTRPKKLFAKRPSDSETSMSSITPLSEKDLE